MFKAYGIAEAKNKETTRFISERIDVAAKLAANKEYLEIISKKVLTQLLILSHLPPILIQT